MKIDPKRVVRIVVRGRAADDDRPTVADLIAQVEDLLKLLQVLEHSAHPDDSESEVVWRVAAASMSSPLTMDFIGDARRHGFSVEKRVIKTKNALIGGMRELSSHSERPPFFTDEALETTERIFHRVTNGLSQSDIVDPVTNDAAPIRSDIAARAERHVGGLLFGADASWPSRSKPAKGREAGSVEGTLVKVDQWYGHPAFWIRDRLTGSEIVCLASQALVSQWGEEARVKEVWSGKRVVVIGIIEHLPSGQIRLVRAEHLYELTPPDHLPKLDDILDPDFTGGKSPLAYLDEMRGGEEA